MRQSTYSSEPTYTTRAGTPISPIVPMQIRGDGKARYRLCQILPPRPRRLEWIHVYNIIEHKDGQSRPLEQAAQVPQPKQGH